MKKYWYKFKALFYKPYIKIRYKMIRKKMCCCSLVHTRIGTIYDLFAIEDTYLGSVYFKESNVDITEVLDNINSTLIKLSKKFTIHYIDYLDWQEIINYIIIHMKKDYMFEEICDTKITRINLNLDYTLVVEE